MGRGDLLDPEALAIVQAVHQPLVDGQGGERLAQVHALVGAAGLRLRAAQIGDLALGAYAAWRASEATAVKTMLGWAGVAAFGFFFLGLLKLWFWMEMQKNSVIREVKRLELQLASLVALVGRA